MTATPGYDLFLSHATPDKPWVRTLTHKLEALGLRVFIDELEIPPGRNWVQALDEALEKSRFLVLVLSPRTVGRAWVTQEWTAFMARHGPLGHFVPVMLETVEVPAILGSVQYLNALDQNAERVARELAAIVGRPGELHDQDPRRLLLGQHLSFVLELTEEGLGVTGPDGRRREVTPPWQGEDAARFAAARLGFRQLTRKAIECLDEHAELVGCATTLGELLYAVLFDEEDVARLRQATIPGCPPPLVTIRSDDDVLLSLPWELLCHEGSFLVRDGRVDLARSTGDAVGPGALVPEPAEVFSLVVNVSAPEGSALDYEGESYRITRALSESCALTPTELGTVADLLETAERVRPTGIHFSGHGIPGRLQFEDDEGRSHVVAISELAGDLRRREGLPPFFYLASCHGNEPVVPEEGRSGAESSAAHLHRAGVAQVVGYYGPIHDELSTRAEEALYGALAAGETARYALRQARAALQRRFRATGAGHRAEGAVAVAPESSHPFAWAQLVFYHRGPDRPLCRGRFGAGWEAVVQQVDRAAGDDSAQRFLLFLDVLLQNVPRLVLYLDNLESLLVGPDDPRAARDEGAMGEWRSPALAAIWRALVELAGERELVVVASCRYRHPDFGGALLPVSPLQPDALYRMMGWFPALRRLSGSARAGLVERLAGHPRAVEFANDLVAHALAAWEDDRGPWQLSDPPSAAELERERRELVKPALPEEVQKKLWDDLLLAEIWDRVLDDRARRMLYRMTLLRVPWERELNLILGEPGEAEEQVGETAERLRRTSLLEQIELWRPTGDGQAKRVRHFTVHPATTQFIVERFGSDEGLRRATHLRVGEYLEAQVKSVPVIETGIEAGHHLLRGGEPDRAYELLGPASARLQERGRVREGLRILEPFLDEPMLLALRPDLARRLLGTVGTARYRLGEVEKAIGYYEQALVIAREIGDRRGEESSVGNLGLAYADLGEVEKAIGYYEQALVIAREIGDRRGEGAQLGNLGLAYAALDEVENAIGYHEQALVIARAIGNRRGEGNHLGNLGLAYAELGEVEKAIGLLEQALRIGQEIKDPQIVRIVSAELERLRGS